MTSDSSSANVNDDSAGGAAVGMFHLITHAFFKSLLFMGAGSVIHAVGSNDLPRMGGHGDQDDEPGGEREDRVVREGGADALSPVLVPVADGGGEQ